MKGPSERLKYDLRRVWECPVCRHHERTTGEATWCICRCQEKIEPLKRRPMRMIEDGARRVIPLFSPAVSEPAIEPALPLNLEPTETIAATSPPPESSGSVESSKPQET